MINNAVLDTSILIKIFLQESDSNLAKNLLDRLKMDGSTVVCPNFAKVEFVSTLAKKLKWNILTNIQTEGVIKAFRKTDIIYVKESFLLLSRALQISSKLGETSVYDCIFLALAQKINGIYITADNLFYCKAKPLFKFIELLA